MRKSYLTAIGLALIIIGMTVVLLNSRDKEKENIEEPILNSFVGDNAPLQDEQKAIKTEIGKAYTYNSERTEYSDGTGMVTSFPDVTYANSQGQFIEDVPSLKSCEFCGSIQLSVHEDFNYPLEVIDYNYTSITLKLEITDKQTNKDIPLKVYEKDNVLKIKYQTSIKLATAAKMQAVTIPFGIDQILKWGVNSTTIQFGNISRCTWMGVNSSVYVTARTSTTGTYIFNSTPGHVRTHNSSGTPSTATNYFDISRWYCAFDTSLIPDAAIILNATFAVNVSAQKLETYQNGAFSLVNGTAVNPLAPAQTDFRTIGGSPTSATEYITRYNVTFYSSSPALAQYVTLELNSAGVARVNKTGITQFGIRSAMDIDGVTPINLTNETYLYFYALRENQHANLTVKYQYYNGTMKVTLNTASSNLTINSTKSINASVLCNNNGDCGDIYATAYYNWTSALNTPLNGTEGAKAFYNKTGNVTQLCGLAVNLSKTCSVNWTINATQTGNWLLTINFTSSNASILPNGTTRISINVTLPSTVTLCTPITTPPAINNNWSIDCGFIYNCTGAVDLGTGVLRIQNGTFRGQNGCVFTASGKSINKLAGGFSIIKGGTARFALKK